KVNSNSTADDSRIAAIGLSAIHRIFLSGRREQAIRIICSASRGASMSTETINTNIISLGKANIRSPLLTSRGKSYQSFMDDDDRIMVYIRASEWVEQLKKEGPPSSFELAGPRKKIYFDPSKLRCALVTCGGLCPGLNDIIRSIVM